MGKQRDCASLQAELPKVPEIPCLYTSIPLTQLETRLAAMGKLMTNLTSFLLLLSLQPRRRLLCYKILSQSTSRWRRCYWQHHRWPWCSSGPQLSCGHLPFLVQKELLAGLHNDRAELNKRGWT